MKALITGSIVALALGVTAAAQDSTVTTQTKVSGDDARAVTMRGCLQQTAGSAGFLLLGRVTASGEDLESKTKTKTDVDDDDTNVKSKTATKIDGDDKSVGTAGTVTSYIVMPRDGVSLAAHAGHEVEITGVLVDARAGGDNDADVKIKEKTKVDPENGPDSKVQSKTKAEIPRGAAPQLMAMSVKSVGRSCAVN
jgi:hypothetical protein